MAVNFKPLKDQEASTRFGIELSAKCLQMESAWVSDGELSLGSLTVQFLSSEAWPKPAARSGRQWVGGEWTDREGTQRGRCRSRVCVYSCPHWAILGSHTDIPWGPFPPVQSVVS